jgi:hypothetical protein
VLVFRRTIVYLQYLVSSHLKLAEICQDKTAVLNLIRTWISGYKLQRKYYSLSLTAFSDMIPCSDLVPTFHKDPISIIQLNQSVCPEIQLLMRFKTAVLSWQISASFKWEDTRYCKYTIVLLKMRTAMLETC